MATRSEAEYRKFFQEADLDKSGYLSMDELCKLLTAKGYRDSEVRKWFRSVDTSNDNQISLEEFLSAMGCAPPNTDKEAILRQTFRQFDKDGNGSIDASELQAVFKEMGKHLSQEEYKRMIALGDGDGSGTLDYEEFIILVFGKRK